MTPTHLHPAPEVYVRRRSAPDPYTRPLSRRACWAILVLCALAGAIVAAQVVRGRNDEYRRVVGENQTLAVALGSCRQRETAQAPPGMTFFGTLGTFDLYAREKAPGRNSTTGRK